MAIEIVDLPIDSMVMLHSFFCQRLPEGRCIGMEYISFFLMLISNISNHS